MTIRLRIKGEIFLIDEVDLPLVLNYTWRLHNFGYAQTAVYKRPPEKNKTISMHRLVMGVSDTSYPVIDHINRNPKDNRKCNLRLATFAENGRNVKPRPNGKSKYLGVYIHTVAKKYAYIKAQILVNNKKIVVGPFKTEEEAALAYNDLASKHFGEFANLNVI